MDDYSDGYNDESDADDEYDHGASSPTLPADYPSSPTESDAPPSNQPTPTYRRDGIDPASPGVPIDRWTVDQCADYVVSLGLEQYADTFMDEEINGEALIAIMHDDLKDMGVSSMGHRLTILKGVYDIKIKQNITVEPDHYVPLSADANAPDARVTQDDVVRIINQIKLRDERLLAAEEELRTLKEDLNRIVEDAKRLREDVLPVIRVAKDKSQPLPTPEGISHNEPLPSPHATIQATDSRQPLGIARKISTKRAPNSRDPKLPSPTIRESMPLEPTPAAKAATSQLTASMTSQGSQHSPRFTSQPSPTSPQYSSQMSRMFPSSRFATNTEEPWSHGTAAASTATLTQRNNNTTQRTTGPPSTSTPQLGSEEFAQPQSRNPTSHAQPNSATTDPASNQPNSAGSSAGSGGGGAGAMEFMKSFRVSMDEPCHKVLPVALKKYHIQDDWRQYSLYIVHGDQERCLGLEEKPLILFKQLASEGKKPMFMLRKHAAPAIGFDHTRGAPGDSPASTGPGSSTLGTAGTVSGTATSSTPGGGLMSGGSSVRVQSYADSVQLPGGVF